MTILDLTEDKINEIRLRVENFLIDISDRNGYDIDIINYVDIEEIDLEDAFYSIKEKILDNGGFNEEVIYFDVAIDFLKDNDPSLQESLSIAAEYGMDADSLNSEILASLLKERMSIDEFYQYENEINDFFSELVEDNQTK